MPAIGDPDDDHVDQPPRLVHPGELDRVPQGGERERGLPLPVALRVERRPEVSEPDLPIGQIGEGSQRDPERGAQPWEQQTSVPPRTSASTASATISSAPMLRVAAAPAPATIAQIHRLRRANQKAAIDNSRKSGSVYGASRKNAVGKNAPNSTVRRAAAAPSSNLVSAWTMTSAPRNAALDTISAAPSGPGAGSGATSRTASGYKGKKAALPSPCAYPLVASRRNHAASWRWVAVNSMCHPGSRFGIGKPASVGG
jgi:hypothetical protein